MNHEHWEKHVRPKLPMKSWDELIDLRDQLQTDCDEIKEQIELTKVKRKRTQADREWMVRATAAVRFHSRCIQMVQAELGRVRNEDKDARHAMSMDHEKRKLAIFARLVRERLGNTVAEEIWSAVDAEMSASAQNGGSRG